MKFHLAAALVGAAALLSACGDDDSTGPNAGTAQLRVVNASSFSAGTNVYLGNSSTALASNLGVGTSSSSCFSVPAGNHTVNFRLVSGTANVASTASFNFQAGQRYTVILTGSGTSGSATVLSDANVPAPASGQNAIRFFNASGGAVDIYLTAPSATLGTATYANLANNSASTGGTGGFATYPTTDTQIRTFAAGSANTGTPSMNYTLSALGGNRVATVVLRGGSANPQAIVTQPCS